MTILEKPSEKCHWPVNDSFEWLTPWGEGNFYRSVIDSLVMDIKLMAMCHWPWSMTCGHKWALKKCHWPRSMTEKSVIDWMYTIQQYFRYNSGTFQRFDSGQRVYISLPFSCMCHIFRVCKRRQKSGNMKTSVTKRLHYPSSRCLMI